MSKYLKFIGVLGLLLVLAIPAHAAIEYTVTDMGEFSPKSINNRGEVVGVGPTGKATLWYNGDLTELGTLGGLQSYATDINDFGQIVGHSHTSNGEIHAFLYDYGSMTDLGNFGGTGCGVDGINNNGQMAINIEYEADHIQAFLYDDGSLINLGNFGGDITVAKSINSHGDIVGFSLDANYAMYAFIFSNNNLTSIGPPDGNADAEGINDARQIIGHYHISNQIQHAFLYSDGTFYDINGDKDYSKATGINNIGDLVGISSVNNEAYPFIYKNGVMYGLNDMIDPNLDISFWGAFCINDRGQIAVSSSNYHAYLLTPIPEPSILTLLLSALIGICVYILIRNKMHHH